MGTIVQIQGDSRTGPLADARGIVAFEEPQTVCDLTIPISSRTHRHAQNFCNVFANVLGIARGTSGFFLNAPAAKIALCPSASAASEMSAAKKISARGADENFLVLEARAAESLLQLAA